MKLNSINYLGDTIGRFTYQLLRDFYLLFTHLKIQAGTYILNTDYSKRQESNIEATWDFQQG